MNKKEKREFIKNLVSNKRISQVCYDNRILKRGREDSIWYDSSVLSFLVDGRYQYYCTAHGDVRLTWTPTEDEVVSKGYNAKDIVDFLEEHNLTTDKKVSEAEAKGKLYFGNNNWFEDEIYDTKKEQYIDMSNADISDGPFTIDLSYIDEWIKIYEERGY